MSFSLDPLAVESDDVRKPNVPMAIYHQEANDLLVFLSHDSGWQRLYAVGLDPTAASAVEQALTVSRTAQSAWFVASRPRKEEEHTTREVRASELRAEAMSACRFNLRSDRGMQGVLDRIDDGSGIADLAADCVDLAKLIHDNLLAFEKDMSFDAKSVADELAEIGPLITAATSARRAAEGTSELIDARDRAFTVLDNILDEVRVAGRHAFRKTNDVRRFGSDYQRRILSRSRRKAASQPEEQPS